MRRNMIQTSTSGSMLVDSEVSRIKLMTSSSRYLGNSVLARVLWARRDPEVEDGRPWRKVDNGYEFWR